MDRPLPLLGMPSQYQNYDKYERFNVYENSVLRGVGFQNIFTTAYVLLNYFIVFVGRKYLRARNLRRLRKMRKPVSINHLTSWLSVPCILQYASRTYRLPGGYFGLLMLLTGALGLAHQYFVNSFIVPGVSFQTTCRFNSGVWTRLKEGETVQYPMSIHSTANTVFYAQYQVFLNGGPFGIYEKVDSTYTRFSPTEEDVIGGWNCSSPVLDTVMVRADWQNLSSVQSFLDTQNFLYTEASVTTGLPHVKLDNSIKGFLSLSADQPEDNLTKSSPQQWNVRASMTNNLNGSDAKADSTANVTNLECHLVVKNPNWSPPIIPSLSSLREWIDITSGSLMQNQPGNYGLVIEGMLNAMVMVGGSDNSDQWNESYMTNSTFGCIADGTMILLWIWAILAMEVCLFLLLVLAYIILLVYEYFRGRHIPDGVELAMDTPCCLEEWQLFILKIVMNDREITFAQMRNYSYRCDEDGGDYKLAKNTTRSHLASQGPQEIDSIHRCEEKIDAGRQYGRISQGTNTGGQEPEGGKRCGPRVSGLKLKERILSGLKLKKRVLNDLPIKKPGKLVQVSGRSQHMRDGSKGTASAASVNSATGLASETNMDILSYY